jgi:LacI family transcriptional regulator
MRRSISTTLKDVAKEAGVTVMAASVVLNGAVSSARVSPATRERILEAAERLAYRRNRAALGLSRRRMNTLGLVSTNTGPTLNLYYMEVLAGILSAAAQHGQSTSILTIQNWQMDEKRILDFCDGRIDGLLLVGAELSLQFANTLAQRVPVVAFNDKTENPDIPWVDVDNFGGTYMATRHLVEQGHRRLAHLAGPAHTKSGAERIAGFRRALEEASIPAADGLVLPGLFVYDSGFSRTEALAFQLGREGMPTGIVCGNDACAFGCIDALNAHGIAIPGDVSVTGFDDSVLAGFSRPALTTIRQPFQEMCQKAVELLLAEIGGDHGEVAIDPTESTAARTATLQHPFPGHIVTRDSTGPAPLQ